MLMEALQMLKFALKQRRQSRDINFIIDWCIIESTLEDAPVEPDVDPLAAWFGTTKGSTEYHDKLDEMLKMADVGN